MNAARRHESQLAAWALFALAFIVVGAVPLHDGLRRQSRVADQSPMNSTDVVLLQALDLHDGARRIAALVRTLPRNRPVALVLPEDNALSAAAVQLSALCWPRPAPMIRVPVKGDPQLSEHVRATHASAAFFLGLEIPADLPPGEALSAQSRFHPPAMTAAGLLLAFMVIFGAGSGLVCALGGKGREFHRAEFLALDWLLGAGSVSLAEWLFGFVLSGWTLVIVIALGAVALGTLGIKAECRFARHEPFRILDWLLIAALVAQAVFIVSSASQIALGWDGLMIWEFKARLAFENGGALPEAYFSDADRAWSHPYYPLGLPGLETWLQLCLGRVDQAWLRLPGPLYYFAAVSLLAAGTQRLGGTRRTGLIAAVAFFFVPYYFAGIWGVLAGYADFPIGVLFLAALIHLPRANESPGDARLCAALAALPVWEKSEGRFLWLTLATLAALTLLPRKQWRAWLAMALPGAAVLIAFKIFLAARHTLVETTYLPATPANILAHANRIGPILTHLASELANLENWGLLWPGTALALIALVLRRERTRALHFAIALLLPLAAYLFAFVLTSWSDFGWHMDLALPRLLLQLAPVAILTMALAVPPPFSLANRAPANEDQQP